MANKKDKQLKAINIYLEDKKLLFFQAAKEGISLKRYIEIMVEERANAIRVEQKIVEKPLKQKKEDPKPIIKTIGEDFPPEKTPPKGTEMDISGVFKRVAPGIYSNGKCFELRKLVHGEGVKKTYYKTKEEAIKNQ